jgi:hypothetical protein
MNAIELASYPDDSSRTQEQRSRWPAFSPFVSSRFHEAGEAVSGDAVHAPDEAF